MTIINLADRATFLGGSDAAAVMGLSQWMTPYELWEYKTRRKVKEDDPAKARIFRRGKKLEPFIVEMTMEKLADLGLQAKLLNMNKQYADSELPYLACEIDFEIELTGEIEINGELHTFEAEHINADAKSVTGFARKKWGEIGTEDVPIEYAAQFMHGMSVTDRHYCLVAALRSFDDVDIYWVKADVETIVAMRQKERLFWEEHVLKDVPPDPLTFADLKALFPLADPLKGMVVCDEQTAQQVMRLKSVKAAIKELKGEEEALTFEVAKAIGDNIGLAYNDKPLCTWNNENYTNFQDGKFKEAYPAMYQKFCDTGKRRVLRMKK